MSMKDAISKAASEYKRTKVKKTKIFGQDVYLRMLDSEQRDEFEGSKFNIDVSLEKKEVQGKASMNLKNLRARFVVLVLADENGNQLYDEKKDLPMISKWSSDETDRIFEEGMLFNGMDDASLDTAKKNLKSIPGKDT